MANGAKPTVPVADDGLVDGVDAARAGSRILVWADRPGPVARTPLAGDVITARVIATWTLALDGVYQPDDPETDPQCVFRSDYD